MSSPSASPMPEMSAVSVSPIWAVPVMVGWPVAGLLAGLGVLLVTNSSLKDAATLPAKSLIWRATVSAGAE